MTFVAWLTRGNHAVKNELGILTKAQRDDIQGIQAVMSTHERPRYAFLNK